MGKYFYTASPGKTSDDKFEIEKLKKGEAELRESDVPDRKAMRYMQNDSLSGFLNPKAGAGRGGQGGPTASDLEENSMTSGQRQSMQEAKDAAMQVKKDKAYNAAKTYPDDFAKGGMTASKRADGIAQRGKTRGTIVMCGGGMYKK
jgi:hypothetical protein